MRVLFWTEGFWPAIGGVEVLASQLVPALAARGHEILLVTDDDFGRLPAQEEFRSIPIRRLGMRAALLSRSPEQVGAMQATVVALRHEFAPQLVHLNCMGASSFFLRRSSAVQALPTLVTLHSERATPLASQPTLVIKLLSDATWVTAVCHAVLAKASQQVPAIRSRSSIIYNAVTEPDVAPQPLPFDPPRIVCVGRLAPEKGLDRAIDAFARITTHYPQLRLVMCGEGAERSALEAQAQRLGVDDKVDFIGWVNPARVAETLNTATLLFMPSRWEGLPLAGIEAALMARPIVATRVGGIPELIEHGVNGVLADADPDALAVALRSLLDDPAGAIGMDRKLAAERANDLHGSTALTRITSYTKGLLGEAGDAGRDEGRTP